MKLKSINYLDNYLVEIEFENNIRKIVNLESFLWGEAFEELKDMKNSNKCESIPQQVH